MRETVGRGSWNSIALNDAAVPYIAFYDSVAGALQVGVRGPQGWTVEVVDDDGDVGKSCNLAIGADGSLHARITMQHEAFQIREACARSERSGRSRSSLPRRRGTSRDLALDSEGDVHIAFYDKTEGDLEYATTSRRVSVQSTSWGRARAMYR